MDEDRLNGGSYYDMIEHVLQDVDVTKADTEVALTGTRNEKNHSQPSLRYQNNCQVGTKSSLIDQNRNKRTSTSTSTIMNNHDEEKNFQKRRILII